MPKCIGIDLGTTNSVAAIKKLQTEVLKNAENDFLTRSCVGLRDQRLIIGKPAFDLIKSDPQNTIVSVKRLMGRGIRDEEVVRIIDEMRYDYSIRKLATGTEDSIAVVLGGKEYTPEQISAEILKKVKQDAEMRLADSVEFAVITVPAYFNDKQKHATHVAANLAGLKVQRILPEPTAAAISFGVDEMAADEAKTVLVFDYGGGTLDISVLTIADRQFIEKGKGGDMWMGGDDIDQLLTNYVYEKIAVQYDIKDIRQTIENMKDSERVLFRGTLREKVEEAKKQLSQSTRANISIFGLLKDEDGDIVNIDVDIERSEFNRLINKTVDLAVAKCVQVIADLQLEPELIDDYLLVGGSAAIPLVQEKMQAVFGAEKVRSHPRPMFAIAEGAAIMAHRLADTFECPQCGATLKQEQEQCPACGSVITKLGEVIHTISHDYCIRLQDTPRYVMAPRNAILPFKSQDVFKTTADNQRLIHLKFFNVVNNNEESIGSLWLTLNEEHPADTEVLVDLNIDENNEVYVNAKLKLRPEIQVTGRLSRGGTDEKIMTNIEEAIEFVNNGDIVRRAVEKFKEDVVMLINRVYTNTKNQDGLMSAQEYSSIVEDIDRLKRNAERPPDRVSILIENILFYDDMIPDATLEKLKSLEEEAAKLTDSDESKINALAEKVWDILIDEIPNVYLLLQFWAAYSKIEKQDPVLYSEIFSAHFRIYNCIKNGDIDQARKIVDQYLPKVEEILDMKINITIDTVLKK